METIRVNMTPCEDVQTIHASQNDNEAREWGFELHNNGEKINSSSISDQMVFKAYKGGTEQILPENGSVPTTSPIIADIKYPQGELTDQEFLYRQSPTEEDGLANIVGIKGQTLKWNQLIASNETINLNRDSARTYNISTNNTRSVVGHKYYFATTITSDNTNGGLNCRFGSDFNAGKGVGRHSTTFTANDTNNASIYCYIQSNEESGTAISFKDTVLIDLTLIGLDSITTDEFTSLFPLSYYPFNSGSLIPFNGNGIKTVGFNQWDEEWEVGTLDDSTGANRVSTGSIRSVNYIQVLPNTAYYIYVGKGSNMRMLFYDGGMNYLGDVINANNGTFTTPTNAHYMRFRSYTAYGTTYLNDICINISSSKNGTYEPYTESVLSLPISTYFPNGMDGVGTDYDELTNTKATTRMARVDLGSLNWQLERANYNVFLAGVQSYIKPPVDNNTVANIKCALYSSDTNNNVYGYNVDKAISVSSGGALRIRDTSYTDANTFKQSLNGVYLVYPLAIPTETSFTTASLVTENGEVALANENGVLVGKCNSDVSADAGFIEGKIKLSDSDGDVYSNKIQIHVERSPQ